MKIWNFTISGTSLYCFFPGGKKGNKISQQKSSSFFSNFWVLQFFSFFAGCSKNGENSTWRNKNLGCHFWKTKKTEKKKTWKKTIVRNWTFDLKFNLFVETKDGVLSVCLLCPAWKSLKKSRDSLRIVATVVRCWGVRAHVANETLGWDPTCHNPGGHCHWEGEHKKFSPFCLIILWEVTIHKNSEVPTKAKELPEPFQIVLNALVQAFGGSPSAACSTWRLRLASSCTSTKPPRASTPPHPSIFIV